jgi:phosphoserine phosphatase
VTDTALLPSWRQGPTREAVLAFLDAADKLPPERRVAVLDNDGTLWCEKPQYTQVEFMLHELTRAVAERPELAERAEYRAILDRDRAALGQLGLPRVALALAQLHAGITPQEFEARARQFLTTELHPHRKVPYARLVYQPMLELLEALRAHGFATFVVSGGGVEFVRSVSLGLYAIAPEGVVGTAVTYELQRRDGKPVLVRTAQVLGGANEGPTKVANIQYHLGRGPIFAAGNSGGDREMLEYATAVQGPSLALLVDHDDAEREYAYVGKAATFTESESIGAVAKRLGWVVVSMARDWARIFPDE